MTAPEGAAPAPPARLGAGEVHAWLADPAAAVDPAVAAACDAVLSAEERTRHAGHGVEARRREFLVAHALARATLSRYRPTPPAGWRFTTGPHGKPEPEPPCGLRFSLTHCADLAGCAVAAGAVGIDAEPLARAAQVSRLRERFCSPAELAALGALPADAQARRALVLWTLKEAYGKALGLGMAVGFRALTFEVAGEPDALLVRLRDAPGGGTLRWQLAAWEQGAHRLALAVEQDEPLALRVLEWRAEPAR